MFHIAYFTPMSNFYQQIKRPFMYFFFFLQNFLEITGPIVTIFGVKRLYGKRILNSKIYDFINSWDSKAGPKTKAI